MHVIMGWVQSKSNVLALAAVSFAVVLLGMVVCGICVNGRFQKGTGLRHMP